MMTGMIVQVISRVELPCVCFGAGAPSRLRNLMIVKTSRASTITKTIVPSSNSRFHRPSMIVLKSVRWVKVEFGYFCPQAATASAPATRIRAEAIRRGRLLGINGESCRFWERRIQGEAPCKGKRHGGIRENTTAKVIRVSRSDERRVGKE